MPGTQEFTVNGAPVAVEVDAATPLLAVLRDELGLTGSKISCGEGACGACTVLVDGGVVRSCVTPVGSMTGRAIRTIEGLAQEGRLHPVQQAFLDQQAFQCGYCTPGMIMAGVALLAQCPRPRDEDIVTFMQGNICRCGAYPRIIRAIRQATGST